ncbi:YigZ family protein [Dermacoccus sp. Tok2021]|uniref:YigZ family protein n=1 Tax=Dermacoccus sp. Tok2021 TaxID=2826873 RepID=UPI001CA71A0F|nr:YigZ family protein [Dermacoccus sp. Tok2021]MBZ4498534.1 YigZ family protein [Dermacoccus sp. Tok2021]
MVERYTTIARAVQAEIEAKRSRFLCDLVPVASEDEARAVVERARKEHWDARHHCSAFVLGPAAAIRRSNDDGEPSGTAGTPMLDVLTGADLTDVVVVVTRWFGGTLLGTGGLVRAYSDAVRAALDEARLVHYERQVRLTCQVTLADVGRVENALRAAGFVVADVDYATHAAAGRAGLEVAAPLDALGRADAALAELTSGEAAFERVGQTWAAKG